nr:MAG TPA: hypothetical protein [Caudoviricetes sp.]
MFANFYDFCSYAYLYIYYYNIAVMHIYTIL